MHRVLLLGAGKIGRAIASLLWESGDYDLLVANTSPGALQQLTRIVPVATTVANAADPQQLAALLQNRDSVISALPFFTNPHIAAAAVQAGVSYFDLTEDVATTRAVRALADQCRPGCILMPQCGLAPGFISIAARHLTRQLDVLDQVQLRVGALPQYPTNALQYNLTWSTDGLINEYCNPCEAIQDGQRVELPALEGCEQFSLEGVRYEAFNTSGGLGSLAETLQGQVRELSYRTIRYPGHRDLIRFLLHDLRLAEQRDLLKQILERALPVTHEDVVITFVTAAGQRDGQFVQLSDVRRICHQHVAGQHWGAIQITTAAGVCAALDLHVAGRLPQQGWVRQEDILLDEFLQNRFGRYFRAD